MLIASKADMEKKFNTIADVKEQLHKLKVEASLARQLDFMRRGIYASFHEKGGERMIHQTGVNAFSMHDIDRIGMPSVIAQSLSAMDGVDGIHLSFDIDSIDPEHAPGVSTPARGGLTFREAQLALTLLAQTKLIRSIDIVELNPALDHQNRTAELAIDLILSALGNRIL